MNTLTLFKYGKECPVTFEVDNYLKNGNLYVGIVTHEEGCPEPWSDLTVNLNVSLKNNQAFIDINNNGKEIVDWLVNNNLGVLTGYVMTSGFCEYPLFEFNMDKLVQFVCKEE